MLTSTPGNLYYLGLLEEEEHIYVTVTGEIEARAVLHTSDSSNNLPMTYEWIISLNPHLESHWDILGTWYGNPGGYYVTATIDKLDTEKLLCSGTIEAKYDSTTGGLGTYGLYEHNDRPISISGSTTADIRLSVQMSGGFPSFRMIFYPDKATIEYTYGPDKGRPVPLTRQ